MNATGKIFAGLEELAKRHGHVQAMVGQTQDGKQWASMVLAGEEEPGSDIAGGAGHGLAGTALEALTQALEQFGVMS